MIIILKYKFRIGSRSWQIINSDEPAMSYIQSILSSGGLFNSKGNYTINYKKSKNIHIFEFDKVILHKPRNILHRVGEYKLLLTN